MAIYHMNVKIGSRSKGQSAIAASAYRAGVKMTDEQTGLTSDYTKKSGVVFSEVSLCANAPVEYADREKLWNAVHKIEKAKNSQLWREIELALPKEFSRDEQIATVREYVKGLTDRGMCADWSLHDKGDGNPHAHIMLTVRSILPDGSWAAKSRKVYVLDENGNRIYQGKDKLGRRQYKSYKEDFNDWNDKERIEEWRSEWAECCNRRLPEHSRIDHRSYVRQGVNQIPTIHEGYVARKRVRNGQQSDRVDINAEIREQNALLDDISRKLQIIAEAEPDQKIYLEIKKSFFDFKKYSRKVQELNTQISHSWNPFKRKALREEVEKTAKKLKKSTKTLQKFVSLYYESTEFDCSKAPEAHTEVIISRVKNVLNDVIQQAEKSIKTALSQLEDSSESSEQPVPNKDKPLFSIERLMSDEFQPNSQRKTPDEKRKKDEFSL